MSHPLLDGFLLTADVYSILLELNANNSNCSLVACQFLNVLALNDETRLMDQLRFGSRYVRPVGNSTDALEVKHGISLQKIDYIDTYHNVLNVNVWENYVSKETAGSEEFHFRVSLAKCCIISCVELMDKDLACMSNIKLILSTPIE